MRPHEWAYFDQQFRAMKQGKQLEYRDMARAVRSQGQNVDTDPALLKLKKIISSIENAISYVHMAGKGPTDMALVVAVLLVV